MENQIQIFTNENYEKVRCYIDANGTAWLNAEDTARGLGFVDYQEKVSATSGRKIYEIIRWARVNSYLKEFGYDKEVGKDDYIPENIFYRLAMKANNTTAEKFQAWIADEVIPSIRKYGYYVAPNIENVLNNMAQELTTNSDELACLVELTPTISLQIQAMMTKILADYKKNPNKKIPGFENLPGEIWKWFKGHEGVYQGSTEGRARSFFRGKCELLKPTAGHRDYPTICLYHFDEKDNKIHKKTFRLNRLIAETFLPNPENKPEVHHKNNDKSDNRVVNLKWVTAEENREYAHKDGLYLKGEKNPAAKLTEDDVRFIRQNHKSGDPQFGTKPLAEKYGVSNTTILNIVQFKSWKNVH